MDEKLLKEVMLKYKFGLETLETQINIMLEENSFKTGYNPVEHIKSRIKSIDSATKKLEKRGYEITTKNLIEHVHDMIGIRIVVSFLSDVETILNLIRKNRQFKIVKEKDYINNPKDSGYLSYHILIKVPIYIYNRIEYVEAEIQLRTLAMDFWASIDHKMRYKFENKIPKMVEEGILNCSKNIKDLDLKMQKLNDILNDYR